MFYTDDVKTAEHGAGTKPVPIDDSSMMLYVAVAIAVGVLMLSLAAASFFLCPKHNFCREQPSSR